MIKYLIQNPVNHAILLQFLKSSKDTTTEHRRTFLVALEQLLIVPQSGLDQRLSDIIQMLFSNITTPAQFPESFGKSDSSISFLIQIANTPFENEEILILNIISSLLKHTWAFKPFFENGDAIKYMLKRSQTKETAELKYEINSWVVKESH